MKHHSIICSVSLLCALAFTTQTVWATTYHIDFVSGDDTADGLTAATPWQHSPGDPKASAGAKSTKLQPGDTLLFKGGVRYRGTIEISASGTKEQPIIIDGNSGGTFGSGPAIIDGSEPVTGWQRCESAAMAGGNPLWKDIFHTESPTPDDWRALNLRTSQASLPIAQSPNPSDPIFQEYPPDYFRVDDKLNLDVPVAGTVGKDTHKQSPKMILTDPKNLTASDPEYYRGMKVCVRAGANAVFYVEALDFDPVKHRLSLGFLDQKLYPVTQYALFNSVKLIDQPGEFSIEPLGDGKVSRIYFLPKNGKTPAAESLTRAVLQLGFNLNGSSHLEVRGFRIEGQGGKRASGIRVAGPASNVTITDCEITGIHGATGISANKIDGLTITRCSIHHNPGHTRGIVAKDSSNVDVVDCKLERNTGTALDYYGVIDGRVADNLVVDNKGMHANGLTFYLGCKNILIENNQVFDGNVCLTIQEADNVEIRNNIFDSGGTSMTVGLWVKKPLRNVRILHNLFLGSDRSTNWSVGLFSNNLGPEGLIVRNNIIDGLSGTLPGTFSHNIYTRLGSDQDEAHLGEGSLYQPDLNTIFVDPANRDYRLKANSPALNAGVSIGISGNNEDPLGKPVNIGPITPSTQ